MRHDDKPEHREIEVPEFTETAAFKSYRDAVKKVIERAGKRGVSTADIHAKLGIENRKWTLSAIRNIADVQESWTILPTRYSIQQRRDIRRNKYGAIPAVR